MPFLSGLGKTLKHLIYHGLRIKVVENVYSLPQTLAANFSRTISIFYPSEWCSFKTILIYNEPRNKDSKYSSFLYTKTINAIIEETQNFCTLINAVSPGHPYKNDLLLNGIPTAFFLIDSIQGAKAQNMPPDEYGNKLNPDYITEVGSRTHPFYIAMIPVENFQAIFLDCDPVPEHDEDMLKAVNILSHSYPISIY